MTTILFFIVGVLLGLDLGLVIAITMNDKN